MQNEMKHTKRSHHSEKTFEFIYDIRVERTT